MTGGAGGHGSGPRDAIPPGPRSSQAAPVAAQPESHADESEAPCPTGPLRRVVRVVNPLGLHMRLADRFSRTARMYASAVVVWNGLARADGKSLVDLILLSATPNSEVILEVDGPDAPLAMGPLVEVLASPGGEDYTI